MKIISNFVKKPVFTYVIFIVIVLLGFLNLQYIDVEEEPLTDSSMLNIMVNHSSSLKDMEHSVIDALSGLLTIPSVQLLIADASPNGCRFQLFFSKDSSQAENRERVQSVIFKAKHDLPKNAIISMSDNDSSAEGIIVLSLTSETKTISEIAKFIELKKHILEAIDGVSAVTVRADKHDSCTIKIMPDKMNMYKVSFTDIDRAIQNAGLTGSSCQFYDGNVVTTMQIEYLDKDLSNYVLTNQNGDKILLSEVAKVDTTSIPETHVSRINGKTAVTLEIQKKPEAKLLNVCSRVRKEMDRIKKMCESNEIDANIIIDKSRFVVSGIHSVYHAMAEAVFLVCLIVYLCLRSFTLALIPILAIPLSIIPMFMFLKWLSITINIYTLLGMIMAIGLVVDDAIVDMENMHKHVSKGYSVKSAAIEGTGKMFYSLLAMTLVTMLVYLPLCLDTKDKNYWSIYSFCRYNCYFGWYFIFSCNCIYTNNFHTNIQT